MNSYDTIHHDMNACIVSMYNNMRRSSSSIYARWPALLLLLSFVSFTSFVLFPSLILLSCRSISICKVANVSSSKEEGRPASYCEGICVARWIEAYFFKKNQGTTTLHADVQSIVMYHYNDVRTMAMILLELGGA
jgi:hypothetical protein